VASLRLEPADAAAALTIVTEAITEAAVAHDTAEQVEASAKPGRRDLSAWDVAMRERASVVAVHGAEVVGFSDVDHSGYIDMLFVSPKQLRRGSHDRCSASSSSNREQQGWPSSAPTSASGRHTGASAGQTH